MPSPPETRYVVAADGVHIAYVTMSDGARDVVACGDWLTNVEGTWSTEPWAGVAARLATLGRLIAFDPRGGGASDPAPLGEPTVLERAMDDVGLVMDAVGSEQAFLIAHAQATPMAVMFAAAHPDRVRGLILLSPYAALLDRGAGVGFPVRMRDRIVEALVEGLGDAQSAWMREAIPGAEAEEHRRNLAHLQRLGANPATRRALAEMIVDFDVTDVLPAVHAPALVLLVSGDRIVPPSLSRLVGELLPNARVVETEGEGHFFTFVEEDGRWFSEIEEFVTGVRPVIEIDRVLATLLFADIVGSTDRAAAMGDARWRALLERHHAVVAGEVERHRGRLVKSTGDGVLATFDGPARAIRCAQAVRAALRPLGLEMRAGLHTGEIEVSGEDVAGIAVHIAARVAALAGTGEVLVSGAVPPLVVGSSIEFTDRGEHTLKGVPATWHVLAAEG